MQNVTRQRMYEAHASKEHVAGKNLGVDSQVSFLTKYYDFKCQYAFIIISWVDAVSFPFVQCLEQKPKHVSFFFYF